MEALESLNIPSSCAPLILLTGGLRTPEILCTALASRHTHLLGIGRGSVLCPDLPRLLKHPELTSSPNWASPSMPEPDLNTWPRIRKFFPTIPLLGAGVNMAWYIVAIRRLSYSTLANAGPDYGVGAIGAVFWMWAWFDGIEPGPVLLILSVFFWSLSKFT